MTQISDLDHLVAHLGDRVWHDLGQSVPLRWSEGQGADRTDRLSADPATWPEVTDTTVWGAPQRYFWFAGQITPPKAPEGHDLWLHIDAAFGRVMGRSDPQCLIRINGQIVQGGDFNHRKIRLRDSGPAEILIEAGTIEDRRQIGFGLRLMARDIAAEALYYDLLTPLDVARHLPETDHRRDLILTRVHAALRVLDLRPGDPARRAASIEAARHIAREIYDSADAEARPTVTVTGHTHIDVAWLWRVQETRQKMARSISTALDLMQDFPDYTFMYNQGYLLDRLAQDYPELFDRLAQRQRSGQVEIEGALWLEPDANMASGEALVRHLTRGIRYHQETFGVTPRIVWLPDTFGYSAALPQLMAQSGQTVFVTHKMSWNDTNQMPHEVFWWEGLDGTRMPTYFLTTQPMEANGFNTTYCPDLRPSHVMGTWRRYAQKQGRDHLWLCYGHGDGGGGPTRGMLEQIRRMEQGIPGCPRVQHGPMRPFFDDLTQQMHGDPKAYPTWVGELYAEFHRGTFTSVAEVKRNNRRGEATLRRLEALATLAMVRAGHPWPKAQLDALWDVVLLNQFHDILPGSSIPEVYADSRAEFAQFFAQAKALEAELAQALGGAGLGNPLGRAQQGLVWQPEDEGAPGQPAQRADGRRGRLVPSGMVPAGGLAPLPTQDTPARGQLSVSTAHLENDLIRAEFDSAGRLSALWDKTRQRQILSGAGNRLLAFRDLPAQFDAWDIDPSYEDVQWEIDDLLSCEVTETGPHRAALRLEWRYERSRIVQVISLSAGSPVLEVDCHIDWREPNTLLKAAFDLDLRCTEVVAETQFGHVRRPTHRNTSWDKARFEHPMHRWVALHEPGPAGQVAALLNDCKYGYDAQGSTLRLTLLRAPTWPWDGADIGAHQMRYGLAALGDLPEVPPLAEEFDDPLHALPGATAAPLIPGLVEVPDGLSVEAIKRAEDGPDIILRLCERAGQRQRAAIRLDPRIHAVYESDLQETAGQPLTLEDGVLWQAFTPFQIRSLRLSWT